MFIVDTIHLICRPRLLLYTLVLALIVLFMPTMAQAATQQVPHKTVYIIVVDKLSVLDISSISTPAITRLINGGAVGLTSNRTLGGHNTADGSLTIGSGNLARAYTNGIMGFNRDEIVPLRNQTASQLFYHLTGIKPQNNASFLINLPEILTGMSKESVNTIPGAMGENLRKNGFKVCVIGNGDNELQMIRAGIAIGMDAKGRVLMGDVGPSSNINATDNYLSSESNYRYLEQKLHDYQGQADVIIVDLSDLARLETADTAMKQIEIKQKQNQLRRIDNFINGLTKQMNPSRDLLLLVSTSPSAEQLKNKDNSTVTIAYGKGFQHGFLSSGATRRDYIVANTDLAPTVLNFFSIKDNTGSIIGQPMRVTKTSTLDTLTQASNLNIRFSTINRLRLPLITGYAILLLLVTFLALITIFWLPKLTRRIEPLIVALAIVPLVFLTLGKLNLVNDWLNIITAIAATIFLTFIFMKICSGKGFKAFVLICLVTILAIDIDLLTGSSMIQSSVLGYDPMLAARYYGIGNEFTGVLIGSSIAAGAAIYEWFQKRWFVIIMAAFFLLQCYLIAGPTLGANSDGILTAPAAFLVTIVLIRNSKIRPSVIIAILLTILLAMLGLTIYDMYRPVELQSHIGRAANQIAAGGWPAAMTIITRKLSMNLKLIRYTIWSYFFIVTLLILPLLVYRPVGAMMQLRNEHPHIVKGFIGTIVGAVVALIINDSGIIEAATISVYLVVPLLLLTLHTSNTKITAAAKKDY